VTPGKAGGFPNLIRIVEKINVYHFHTAQLQKSLNLPKLYILRNIGSMSDFKWRHFRGELILGCVRWYCKYGISYRDLEEMMLERGMEVDHTTIYRWVQHYAPEMEKRLRWYWKPTLGYSWRVDETYVKVKGSGRICIELLISEVIQLISIFRPPAIPKPPNGF